MKNFLLSLCAVALTTSVHAQKFEVGIGAGASYAKINYRPNFYSMSGDVETKFTKVTPAFFAKCGYNLDNWQLLVSAGRQTLNASYTGKVYGCFSSFLVDIDQSYRVSQLSLSFNRKMNLKSIKIYAGISGGFVDVLTTSTEDGDARSTVSYHVHGFSAGIQAGILKPISKHWSVNAEIDSKFLRFKPYTMPFNAFPATATMGIVYGIY